MGINISDSVCNDCLYRERDTSEKPCNTCMRYADGYLEPSNYEKENKLKLCKDCEYREKCFLKKPCCDCIPF